ncbi:hypothetical protein [Nakamurella deserti]|uniref:hypothetical protein n=1 Tax=Nakamurella deserti TaxID=2164074 RepID=UPI000DBE3CF0|nr:hypothetical protein [Nakamurella deserti]
MFGALKKLATAGGIAAALRSPQGQQAIAKAKQMAADPANRQKIADLAKKFGGKNKGTRGPGTY